MDLIDIARLRLVNQQITESKFKTVKEIVGWMGAMQAQDFNMSKWAVGIRLPGVNEETINAAIDRGEIIRTHLLRPTWHLVSADDIYWMLKLTASQIKTFMKSRDKELGLTDAVFRKSNNIIEKALSGGNHLAREELVTELARAGIAVDDNRASHLLVRAEIDGILCSGRVKSNKQTYALLPERVKQVKTLEHDEALAELARRYFTSRGPATLQDFVWWSGLPVSESRKALAMIKPDFIDETIDNQIYWFANSFSVSGFDRDLLYLLPAFDEFLISYKDRSASLPFEDQKKAVSSNGIFYPIIVLNGQVIGTWKRTIRKDKVMVEIKFLGNQVIAVDDMIQERLSLLEYFTGKRIVV